MSMNGRAAFVSQMVTYVENDIIIHLKKEINDLQIESPEKSQAIEKQRTLSSALEHDVREAEIKSTHKAENYLAEMKNHGM